MPDRALFDAWKQFQVENPEAPARLEPSRLDLPEGPFLGGDLMNLAIGQGELTATPLQVAQSYAAIVNGGFVYRPHVVSSATARDGTSVYEAERELVRQIDIDPATVQSILADLNRVVTRGTASTAFASFGASLDRVGGKTGTGQTIANNDNHAWFVGVGPIDSPALGRGRPDRRRRKRGKSGRPGGQAYHAVPDGRDPGPDRRGRSGGLMTLLARPDAPPAISDRRRNTPDRLLFITTLALSMLGLLMIYSATRVGLEREQPARLVLDGAADDLCRGGSHPLRGLVVRRLPRARPACPRHLSWR